MGPLPHHLWKIGIFLILTLPVACLPWRSQRESQDSSVENFRNWDEFIDLDVRASFKNLKKVILRSGPAPDTFTKPGPIPYTILENQLVGFSDGTSLIYDNIIPRSASKTPLVILVHGNHSHKEAHRYQAERLASFGIHAISLQVVNQGQWMINGDLVHKFVERVRKKPGKFGGRIDKKNIILAGHSFGGSAITIAAGLGAKVKGLILLDPAVVSTGVLDHMKSVTQPTVLLGADEKIFRARRQIEFSKNIAGDFTKITVKGATHDDAQFPSMYSHAAFGYDPFTTHENQEMFTASITLFAFSLSAKDSFEYGTMAMAPLFKSGQLTLVETRPGTSQLKVKEVAQER